MESGTTRPYIRTTTTTKNHSSHSCFTFILTLCATVLVSSGLGVYCLAFDCHCLRIALTVLFLESPLPSNPVTMRHLVEVKHRLVLNMLTLLRTG